MRKKELEDDPWGGMSLEQALNSKPKNTPPPKNTSPPKKNNIHSQNTTISTSLHSKKKKKASPSKKNHFPSQQTHHHSNNQYPSTTHANLVEESKEPIQNHPDQNERAVAFNPSGKYNLNFIDWDNEFEQICDYLYEEQYGEGGTIPIEGMDRDTYLRLIDVELETFQFKGVSQGDYCNFKLIKAKAKEPGMVCAICLAEFNTGEILRILPCNHSFHDNCLFPWLSQNHVCPMCRYDLLQ